MLAWYFLQAADDRLCVAALDNLAVRNPDLKVMFGAAGAVRWSMFGIGIAALAFGVIIALIAGSGGVNDGKALGAFVVGGAFVVFGAGLAWSYRPWAPPALLPVKTARDLLERLSLSRHPKGAEDGEEEDEDGKG